MAVDNAFSSGEMQMVTFNLGNENFGINIMDVQEIIRTPSITVIPQAPDYVEGVTNLRGNILPVLDTRIKFGMEKAERDVSSRVVVVVSKGKAVGLSVDGVSEVLRIEGQNIEPAPAMVSGSDATAIAGMVKIKDGKKVVMILDAAQLSSIGESSLSSTSNVKAARELNSRGQENKIEEVQLVSFFLGKEEFALEIERVCEIIRYPEIVKVPNVPDYVKGVISLRERLIPIIDMRIKLATGVAENNDNTRVVVIDVDNIQLGLVVDKVNEVARIPKDSVFPPPQGIAGEQNELQGIVRLDEGKRIIMLLDAHTVMSFEEFDEISQIEGDEFSASQGQDDGQDEVDEEKMVVFKLAEEEYGVRISQVQEIDRLSNITKVPRAPRYVEGVVNRRGDVIPVIDLRKRFEMDSKEYTEFTRIIVSDINKKKIGLIVDEVLEVLRVPSALLEEAPDILQGDKMQNFMDGIANLEERMIMMVNLENILLEKEWDKIAGIQKSQSEKKQALAKAKPKAKLKKQGRSRPDDKSTDS
jgi:purine-binding chemotaxis protein CheW